MDNYNEKKELKTSKDTHTAIEKWLTLRKGARRLNISKWYFRTCLDDIEKRET